MKYEEEKFNPFKQLYKHYLSTLVVSFLFFIGLAATFPFDSASIAKISIVCFFIGAALSSVIQKKLSSQEKIDELKAGSRAFYAILIGVISIVGGAGFAVLPIFIINMFNVYL
jgi:uncharacterized membrane protein YfcA